MKMLACKDMGMSDGFVAKGMTEDEVMSKMDKHMREAHPEKMDNMTSGEVMKMKDEMRSKIKDEM